MRVAFCVSGQPRTWRQNFKSWKLLAPWPDAQIDYFLHAWDFNTQPSNQNDKGTTIAQDEFADLFSTLSPRKILVEPEKRFDLGDDFHVEQTHPDQPRYPAAIWNVSQFYGIMRAASLKRQYEIEGDFEYDVCVRLRYDLVVMREKPLVQPEIGAVYTIHNSVDVNYKQQRIGDLTFYARSLEYDRLASFYRHMRFIDEELFERPERHSLPPEFPLYYYAKMIGLRTCRNQADVRVRRDAAYAEAKGGKLEAHEVV